MSAKPMIAMNCDFRPPKGDQFAFSWIHSGYYDSILKCGGIPIVMPQYPEDDELRRVLETVDGLVLTGCKLDLDPVLTAPSGADVGLQTLVVEVGVVQPQRKVC